MSNLPKHCRYSQSTLRDAPEKPTDNVINYRPISLLNCDIKIFSKLIADRKNLVLPSLIHPDQVGFVSNRQGRDGTRRILNLMQLAKLYPSDSILLSLDTEKAFDRVNSSYLSHILGCIGFGGPILNAILSFYSSPSTVVLATDFLSTSFDITNRTRQGCPLSPLIFALCIEPLAISICFSPKISSIKTGQNEHKIGLYVDDIILICTSPARSLKALMALISEFS